MPPLPRLTRRSDRAYEQVGDQRVDEKYLVVADLMGEDGANREEYNGREEFGNNDREEDAKGVSFLVEF